MGKNKEKGFEQVIENNTAYPKNVLFVGGQERFIIKMKKKHPEWTYLNMSERNCGKVKGEYDCVVVQCNHTSHNIIERAMAYCKAPVIYSNSTNIDRCIFEINSRYEKLLEKCS